MKLIISVICQCGVLIPDENIDEWNIYDEEDENYCVVAGACDSCSSKYEAFQWGEWKNKEEAKIYLNIYISEINKSK